MKRVFYKPVMHFIPLIEGMRASSLSRFSDDELKEVLFLCRKQEEKRIYQISNDVIKRQVGDEWILVPTGALAQKFNGMVSLSETGNFIWEQLQKPISLGQLLEIVQTEFSNRSDIIDIETRNFVSDYHQLGFLRELKQIMKSEYFF